MTKLSIGGKAQTQVIYSNFRSLRITARFLLVKYLSVFPRRQGGIILFNLIFSTLLPQLCALWTELCCVV